MLDIATIGSGRRTVLKPDESKAINKTIISAAEKGFALDNSSLKCVLQNISADGYATDIPSDAAIRIYRAQNRDIRYRKRENKDTLKQKAENYSHVETFAQQLKLVQQRHPDIFEDLDRLINLDETHVDGEFGCRYKVFGSATTQHGGSIANKKRSGKHLTAIIHRCGIRKISSPFHNCSCQLQL